MYPQYKLRFFYYNDHLKIINDEYKLLTKNI